MTATLTSPSRHGADERHGADGRITLYGIGWDAYESFIDSLGERPVHVNYDEGAMEIMTISSEHEAAKKRVAMLIEYLALVLRMPLAARGSTTFKDKRIHKGAEPDECYYIANEAKIRRKKKIDLRKDPPPDLVVEIDISYHEVDREAIYAEMGVPELWRYDGKRLGFFALSNRDWKPIDRSRSFPMLRPEDMNRFLRMAPRKDDTSLRWAFADWVGAQAWAKSSDRGA
ncbi:MAG: Uma2 family endonuclease [Tepidisphaeraceae bacterium]